jgi:hypothetical protein
MLAEKPALCIMSRAIEHRIRSETLATGFSTSLLRLQTELVDERKLIDFL